MAHSIQSFVMLEVLKHKYSGWKNCYRLEHRDIFWGFCKMQDSLQISCTICKLIKKKKKKSDGALAGEQVQ